MATPPETIGSTPKVTGSTGWLTFAVLPLSILLPVALIGPNSYQALYACAALALGIGLLWRLNEPPILLFIFAYQWVQASIGVFYGNLIGVPVEMLAVYRGLHGEAVYLLITGLIVLALAMHFASGPARWSLARHFREMVSAYPARTWIAIYVITWLFSAACSLIAPFSGGLRQAFLFLAEVKWAAFLLLTASTFGVRGRSKVPWTLAFVVEFVLSIGGFFAEFSNVFYYSLIGIAFARNEIFKRNKVIISIIVVVMLAFAIAWTAVKRDYRDFINQGTREQVVLVDYQDRMADLLDRIAGLNAEGMADGAEKLVMRLSYFEFFGVVLQRDEMGQPHAGGAIWGAGALSPFMPRLLFPNKPVADDTALLTKYTGLNQAAWRTGTSISLGYMTEAFVDFGRYGMFAAIGALGLLIGLIHRWLLGQKGWRHLVGISLVPVALMPAHLLESSIVKLLPALIISVLCGLVVLKFLAPIVLSWAGVIGRKPMEVPVA